MPSKYKALTFELTNNNANIRRIEGRILELEKKEELSSNEGEKEFLFDGFKVVYNYTADRIQVMHDEKPTRELMNELKHQGFKFSFNNTAWQRHLNNGGIYAAMNVLKIDLPRID